MKILKSNKDGGPESNVTAYWLIEWKSVFSIALLRFDQGSREAFHSHAFNCVSWVLKGELLEYLYSGRWIVHRPSLLPIVTARSCLHKVFGVAPRTWVLTFRGPWRDHWHEVLPDGRAVTLTDGRVVAS